MFLYLDIYILISEFIVQLSGGSNNSVFEGEGYGLQYSMYILMFSLCIKFLCMRFL